LQLIINKYYLKNSPLFGRARQSHFWRFAAQVIHHTRTGRSRPAARAACVLRIQFRSGRMVGLIEPRQWLPNNKSRSPDTHQNRKSELHAVDLAGHAILPDQATKLALIYFIGANGTTLEVMSRRHVVRRRSNALWRLDWTHGQPIDYWSISTIEKPLQKGTATAGRRSWGSIGRPECLPSCLGHKAISTSTPCMAPSVFVISWPATYSDQIGTDWLSPTSVIRSIAIAYSPDVHVNSLSRQILKSRESSMHTSRSFVRPARQSRQSRGLTFFLFICLLLLNIIDRSL
jgi:hypothetical protein